LVPVPLPLPLPVAIWLVAPPSEEAAGAAPDPCFGDPKESSKSAKAALKSVSGAALVDGAAAEAATELDEMGPSPNASSNAAFADDAGAAEELPTALKLGTKSKSLSNASSKSAVVLAVVLAAPPPRPLATLELTGTEGPRSSKAASKSSNALPLPGSAAVEEGGTIVLVVGVEVDAEVLPALVGAGGGARRAGLGTAEAAGSAASTDSISAGD